MEAQPDDLPEEGFSSSEEAAGLLSHKQSKPSWHMPRPHRLVAGALLGLVAVTLLVAAPVYQPVQNPKAVQAWALRLLEEDNVHPLLVRHLKGAHGHRGRGHSKDEETVAECEEKMEKMEKDMFGMTFEDLLEGLDCRGKSSKKCKAAEAKITEDVEAKPAVKVFLECMVDPESKVCTSSRKELKAEMKKIKKQCLEEGGKVCQMDIAGKGPEGEDCTPKECLKEQKKIAKDLSKKLGMEVTSVCGKGKSGKGGKGGHHKGDGHNHGDEEEEEDA